MPGGAHLFRAAVLFGFLASAVPGRAQDPPPVPVSAPAPPAREQCTIAPRPLVSRLDHGAPGVRTLHAPRREDSLVTESLALPEGVSVTFSIGGCHHFGVWFQYEGVRGRRRLDNVRHYVALALELLERTPRQRDTRGRPVGWDLADGLRAALRTPPATDPLRPGRLSVSFGCSTELWAEASCELVVEPAYPGHVRVRVGYMFAP